MRRHQYTVNHGGSSFLSVEKLCLCSDLVNIWLVGVKVAFTDWNEPCETVRVFWSDDGGDLREHQNMSP